MNSSAANAKNASQNLMGALADKKSKITESLPWKDLDNDDRIERLRAYTKKSIGEILTRQQKFNENIERQLQEMRRHRHNEAGRAIVETELGNKTNEVVPGNDYPSVAMSALQPSITTEGGEYI